jgi:glutamyl-tRNA synthetase
LGNVLSFALTASLARDTGASILLRIDDLDKDRVRPQYLQDIFDTLEFMGLPWNEGPRNPAGFESHYAQRHRLHLYQEALGQLKEGGHVFACTCSRAQLLRQGKETVYPGTCRHLNLPLDTPGASWRLRTDPQKEMEIKTVSRGTIKTFLPASLQDFVVRKKDGFPAYQLSSVVDDLHYGIDLIVRGSDLWPSTIAQHYISSLPGYEKFKNIHFHHHALLTAPDGSKLSKSAGSTSIHQLRKEGRSREEILAIITESQ